MAMPLGLMEGVMLHVVSLVIAKTGLLFLWCFFQNKSVKSAFAKVQTQKELGESYGSNSDDYLGMR